MLQGANADGEPKGEPARAGPVMDLLVRGARQLLTLHGPTRPRRGDELSQLGLIEDGAVFIQNGTIAAVGPTRRLENIAGARKAEVLEARGKTVLPGFVDGYLRLTPADAPGATARTLEWQARQTLWGCIRHGTTTIGVHAGTGWDESMDVKALRAIGRLHQAPLDIAVTYNVTRAGPTLHEHLLSRLAQRSLIQSADLSGVRDALPAHDWELLLEEARAAGLPLRATAAAHMGVEEVGVVLAMGAATLDRVDRISLPAARQLGQFSVLATLLPALAFHTNQENYPEARLLIESGVPVSLASGFDREQSSTYGMPFVIALACLRMRMTPAEAISAATINSAYAVGRASRVGSLEFGKQADLVILGSGDYRDLAAHLGVNPVERAIKRGRIVTEREFFPGTERVVEAAQ